VPLISSPEIGDTPVPGAWCLVPGAWCLVPGYLCRDHAGLLNPWAAMRLGRLCKHIPVCGIPGPTATAGAYPEESRWEPEHPIIASLA
jgi:hypothetical protein